MLASDTRLRGAFHMTSELFDLRGQVAVVTGGGRGIGRAIAEALAGHGARVSSVAAMCPISSRPRAR